MTFARLPNRRRSAPFEFTQAIPYTTAVSRHPDGSFLELFLNPNKPRGAADANARDAVITLSIGIQSGADAAAIRRAVRRATEGGAPRPLGQELNLPDGLGLFDGRTP